MRLASARLFPIVLPYTRSVTWSKLTEKAAPMLLLRLEADSGEAGVGEVTAKVQWCGMTFAQLTTALEEVFLPMLEGEDLEDIAGFTARAGKIPENTVAKALVENALWDLRAAHDGRPFWSAWKSPPEVPMSWVLTRQAPDVMAAEAADMISRYGFRALKLKGGQGIETDLQAIRSVCQAAGSGVRVFVDANGYYDAATAPSYVAALAAEGVCAVEDPYPLEPDSTFERIQKESSIPIIVDFAGGSLRNAKLFCERGAQAIGVKPGFIGIPESLRIAEFALRHECAVNVGVGGESEVGSLAALAASARLTIPASWLPSETSFFLLFQDRVLLEPLQIQNGNLRLPDTASIAELIDWKRVDRYRS